MKPLAPISEDAIVDDQRDRAARRAGLHFFIDQRGQVKHGGYSRESREATEEELGLWQALIGNIEGVLTADLREFERLRGHKIVYLNAEDLAVLRSCRDAFEPRNAREELLLGWFGTLYANTAIWVSRLIPKGYYLASERVLHELTWRPKGEKREVAPELDEHLRCELEDTLAPLLC
jgi:hypothetical protein